MEIYGHRGSAGTHPENTMISFQEAARVGAIGIELDVHMSKDGELMVIHDEKVDRTTGHKGYIKDMTYAQIRKLDASYKFKKKYGACPIPSLAEVLEWIATTPLLVNIELKNNVFEYRNLELVVLNMIYHYGLKDRVILSSFNHNSLVRAKSFDSTIPTAILYSYQLFEPWTYAQSVGADALHPNFRTLNDVIVSAAQHDRLAVRPYTVNNADKATELFQMGCDAIITDYPEKMRELFS